MAIDRNREVAEEPLIDGFGLPIVRFGVQTPVRAEIWFEISVPCTCAP